MALPDLQLQPLPYHEALANYLNAAESEAWEWFASTRAQSDYAEELRLELLKQTYRLDAATHPEVFHALDQARACLTPDLPVTLYQSQKNHVVNASIYCLPGEAHIVFEGNVLQLLAPAELLGVFGHELAHYRLWNESSARFFVTDRMAQAMASEPRAEPSQVESARLLRLYTEIYADRGALCVTGDAGPVITGLVKLHTGLTQVDADSYVKQANEVFARSKARTEGLSHPETFIRARAIRLWADKSPEADYEVTRMIEGTASLEKLDLLGQRRLTDFTLRWLRLLLRAPWFQSDPVKAHARLYFPDLQFATTDHTDDDLLAALREVPINVRDYFCYLLLDFSAIDPELEDEPLKAAYVLAQKLGWEDRLEALSVKELKLKKRDAKRVREEALPPAPEPIA
jgi:hypothetical protein